MDLEITDIFAEDFSVEEFDIDFEFDAPRFYDFSKPELHSETELWFKSAGNYPSSPFSLNLRFEEIPKPISDKYNGFIYYNQAAAKDVPKTTHKSKTKLFLRKNSTLTRPTAFFLARQNKPLDIYSLQLLTRCQRSLEKFDDKISSLLYSMPQTQDTKRQKLESGFLRKVVSRLEQTPFVHKVPRKGSKVTVPKEPNLKTAQRATRHRFKANSAPEHIEKFSSTMNKQVQETSSISLSKKNTPRSQDFQFQAFHLRTNLRARERSSNPKILLTNNPAHSLMFKSVVSRQTRKIKEAPSSKKNRRVYDSKICLLDSKGMQTIPSKCGEAIEIQHENNFPRVSHTHCSSSKEFEAPKDTNFRDERFIESLRNLCLTSDTDSVAVLLD